MEIDVGQRDADSWFQLGVTGDSFESSYTKTQCYVMAIGLQADHVKAWYNLGVCGGAAVNGKHRTPLQCYVTALELDPKHAKSWNNLGICGGGLVCGRNYTPDQCFSTCLELDPMHARAWSNLGACGGGTVHGKHHTNMACYHHALRLKPQNAHIWHNLGMCGGGEVAGEIFTSAQCHAKALELDPKYAQVWSRSHCLVSEGRYSQNSSIAFDLASRGFTVQQLLQFCRNKSVTKTMCTRDVVRDIIIPETAAHQTCYMDSGFMQEHGGRKRAQTFVSHAWQSKFLNTVQNILYHASEMDNAAFRSAILQDGTLNIDKAFAALAENSLQKTYWLCIFAINEHKTICGNCFECQLQCAEEFAAPVCPPLPIGCGRAKDVPCSCGSRKSKQGDLEHEVDAFAEVLHLMDALVVSLDPTLETLRRLWVAAEVGAALMSMPIILLSSCDFSNATSEQLWKERNPICPIKDCHASSPEDKRMILTSIDGQSGGHESFNEALSIVVELRFGMFHTLANVSDDALQGLACLLHLEMYFTWAAAWLTSVSQLGQVQEIARLTQTRRLWLNFACCSRLLNVSSLGHGLAKLKGLQSLTMSFKGCDLLSDVSSLGQALEELNELRELSLDFGTCEKLQDPACLVRALSVLTELRSLALNFSGCRQLADASCFGHSLQELSLLQDLSINLSHCTQLKDASCVGHGLAKLHQLQALVLDLSTCYQLPSVSFLLKGLAELQEIRELNISFSGCIQLADASSFGRSFVDCQQLQKLTVSFAWCDQVKDISCIGHGLGKLKHLHELTFDFSDSQLADVASLASGLAEMPRLRTLRLFFSDCCQLADISALGQAFSELREMRRLVIVFSGCIMLTQALSLGYGLSAMKHMQELSLDFRHCKQLKDLSCLGHAIAGLRELVRCNIQTEDGREFLAREDFLVHLGPVWQKLVQRQSSKDKTSRSPTCSTQQTSDWL